MSASHEHDANGDESTQFFDAEAEGRAANAVVLTPEEREQLEQELKKTEDEIGTLRQVLTARIKHANDLKHKLGVTPWAQVTHDVSEGLAKVKETNAYQKTTEVVHQTTDVVSKKLGQLRNSNAYKSFEQGLGTAYTSVKAKMSASTSMNQFYGTTKNGTEEAGAATEPNTPSNEKSPLS